MHFARISLYILSVIFVLLLAACGGAGNQVVEPKLAEPILGSSSHGATLRLANEGGAPLTFEVVSSDERMVVSPQQGTLEANKTRTLDVSAVCDTDTLSGELTVTTNDVATPTQRVPLTLTCGASAPAWWLSANTLTVGNYGEVSTQAEAVTKRVTLSNSGRVKSDYTLSSNQDWVTFANASGTLDVGESDTLELSIEPCTEPKRDEAELRITGGGASASLSVVRDCDVQNAATLDLKVERFYINQAVPAADSSRPPHERRALVASRSGLARAFVQANQINDQAVTVRLHYKNANEEGYLDLTGPRQRSDPGGRRRPRQHLQRYTRRSSPHPRPQNRGGDRP